MDFRRFFRLTKKGEPLIIVEWECAHQRFVLKVARIRFASVEILTTGQIPLPLNRLAV